MRNFLSRLPVYAPAPPAADLYCNSGIVTGGAAAAAAAAAPEQDATHGVPVPLPAQLLCPHFLNNGDATPVAAVEGVAFRLRADHGLPVIELIAPASGSEAVCLQVRLETLGPSASRSQLELEARVPHGLKRKNAIHHRCCHTTIRLLSALPCAGRVSLLGQGGPRLDPSVDTACACRRHGCVGRPSREDARPHVRLRLLCAALSTHAAACTSLCRLACSGTGLVPAHFSLTFARPPSPLLTPRACFLRLCTATSRG